MPVEKELSYALIKQGESYTVTLNSVTDLIRNPIAYALWHYLMSKPQDWEVMLSSISAHFDLGRDRIRSAIKYLKDLGLVIYTQNRCDKTGKILSNTFIVRGFPLPKNEQNHRPPENPSLGQNTQITDPLKNPTVGKTTPLQNKDIYKQNKDCSAFAEKPKPRSKKTKQSLPPDFEPNDKHWELAKELEVDLAQELENFKDYHLANGNKFLDWDAGLRTWLRKSKNWKLIPIRRVEKSSNVVPLNCYNKLSKDESIKREEEIRKNFEAAHDARLKKYQAIIEDRKKCT